MKTHGHLDFKMPTSTVLAASLSLFLGLFLGACAFSENPGGPPPPKKENVIETLQGEKDKEAQNGILTADNVSVEFVENPTPGIYNMVVRWPKAVQHVTIKINNRLATIIRNTDVAEFKVEDDTEHKIEMVSYGLVSPAPLSAIELKVRSPIDFIVDEQMNLSEAKSIVANRLYFTKVGKIRTNGFPLSIQVSKMYVDRDSSFEASGAKITRAAHILTNTIGEKTKTESDLKGSIISIVAKEAHGHLLISMVGVDGKKGLSGVEVEKTMSPIPSRTAPVNPALNGRNGVETEMGRPCRGSTRVGDMTGCGSSPGCTTAPTSGKNGDAGGRGTRGGQGGDGGSFGILDVSIENSDQFKIDVGTMNGLPGEGGEGAPGFPGVMGGKAGASPGTCTAFSVSDGTQGKEGPQGPPGLPGGITPGSNIRGGRTPINVFEISR